MQENFSRNLKERNLSDAFEELQQSRMYYENQNRTQMQNKRQGVTNLSYEFQNNSPCHESKTADFSVTVQKIVLIIIGIIFIVLAVIPKNDTYAKEEEKVVISSDFEENNNTMNLTNIIIDNIKVVKSKKSVKEEREIPFEEVEENDPLLPKDERVIVQEGKNGLANISAVQTFENDELIEEKILESNTLEEGTKQIVHIGTSEFLANHKIHIGDKMYLTQNSTIKSEANNSSKDINEIKQYMDVTLTGLSGEWCKISFENQEGFIKSNLLTSSSTTPSIVEKNRIQKIIYGVNIDMPLNNPSGLNLSDFKKILSNNPDDTNNVFKNNYKAFYDVEQKYNVNGVFLAALAIHESAWGTSQIANDKKNLFGYGAYDSDPYNGSYEFEEYIDGIELVAKVFAKYYINPAGTKIYDDQLANAKYYYGTNLQAINQRYSTDKNWYTKVYKYMDLLYNKLV